MNMSGAKTICLTVAFGIVTALVLGTVCLLATNYERVILGVRTPEKNLAGMSRNEVEEYFARRAENLMKDGALCLFDDNREWRFSAADIALAANAEEAAYRSFHLGHSGNLWRDIVEQIETAVCGEQIKLTAAYDQELLQQKFAQVAADIRTEPQSAYCALEANGLIQKFPAVIGRELIIDGLEGEVREKLLTLKLPAQIKLAPQEKLPSVRDEDVAAIDNVLSVYATHFAPGDRGNNIAIAAGFLSGALVRPGETFSFNERVGPRTAAAGYKDAGVIIDGQLAQDVGGGVCQVSSTLYNAILLAGLTPTERTPHFYPSAYCPPGLDATVADGLIDFKFQNRLAHSVYLISKVGYNSLNIYVLGTKADLGGNTITLYSDGKRLNPSVYRLYSQGGVVVSREFLHTDAYSTPKST